MIHFAKVFGIVWAIIMLAYVAHIYFAGFAVGIRLHGQWRPSKNMMIVLFWAWPAVLALVIAAFWESIAVAVTLFRSKSHV